MHIAREAQKIVVLGYSGSGKSTLASRLAEEKHIPIMYLDSVHWLPGWQERPNEEMKKLVSQFLDNETSWVIDGTYSGILFERRLRESDCIIVLNTNRFTCLWHNLKRLLRYHNTTRPDLTQGCDEKIDAEFLWWLLWKGRSARKRLLFRNVATEYSDKCITVRNSKTIA